MEYNPKIAYLFCKYIDQEMVLESEIEAKAVYSRKRKPRNQWQRLMQKTDEILKEIPKKKFSSKSIIEIYKTLDGRLKRTDEKKIKEIIRIKSNEQLFRTIIADKCFQRYNEQMAKIIINFRRIKQKQIPIIFYPKYTKELIKEIHFGVQNRTLKELLIKTRKLNKQHEEISLVNIKQKIKEKERYIKKRFGVKELYIFGSYAIGESNSYSDIDIYLKDYGKEVSPIRKYLSRQIGIKADIVTKQILKEIGKIILRII